jgi:hypothetical protein
VSLAEAEIEIVKLARLLRTDAGELDFLRQIAWRDLRDLREQMTVVMFENDRQMLQRVAATTKLVPPKITAAIGERAFGPLLCARVAGLLDPSRGVDIIGHLPTRFLADVAGLLDARRASRLIAEIPPQKVAEITRELVRRGDHVTMGGFVGHLSERALQAALDVADDATLLRTAYVVESKRSLGALVDLIPEERLERIMRTATEADLWREALDVLRHVGDRRRGMLGDVAAAQDDDVLAGLVKAAQRDGLWADVLPVTRAMSVDSRARFAKLKPIQTRPVLASIVDAASQRGLWAELLTLLPLLPAASRRRVAALGTGFGRSILAQIMLTAHREDLWAPLVRFASELEARTQKEVATLAAALDDDVLGGLLDAVAAEGLQAELALLAGRLGPKELRAFARRAPAVRDALAA